MRLLVCIVAPLAIASGLSLLISALADRSAVTLVTLRLNNTFGAGLQAAFDTVRVWFGGDWLLADSWTPMLDALKQIDSGGASSLYQSLFFDQRTKFQYPPTSLLPLDAARLVVPVTAHGLNRINALFMLANTLAVAALAYTVWDREHAGAPAAARAITPSEAAAIAFCASWLFFPLPRAFQLGQIQLWIDLAFTLACLCWITDRKMLAGAAIGLTSMIKPQLGLFVVWALFVREWKFATGFVIAALPISLLSLLRYGLDAHLSYLNVLSYISQHGESYFRNHSSNGLVNRLLFNGTNLKWQAHAFAPFHRLVYTASLLATIAFLALPFARRLRDKPHPSGVLDFAIAALCFTLASPVSWDHHYGIMLPMFVLALGGLWTHPGRGGRQPALRLLACAWVLSAGVYGATSLLADIPVLNIAQSYVFFGALLLLWVLVGLSDPAKAAQAAAPPA